MLDSWKGDGLAGDGCQASSKAPPRAAIVFFLHLGTMENVQHEIQGSHAATLQAKLNQEGERRVSSSLLLAPYCPQGWLHHPQWVDTGQPSKDQLFPFGVGLTLGSLFQLNTWRTKLWQEAAGRQAGNTDNQEDDTIQTCILAAKFEHIQKETCPEKGTESWRSELLAPRMTLCSQPGKQQKSWTSLPLQRVEPAGVATPPFKGKAVTGSAGTRECRATVLEQRCAARSKKQSRCEEGWVCFTLRPLCVSSLKE
ncbi:hypothetical protein H920_04794 [Fukomys damarensis]|uniref:Uncharacterized protein n=1 Tax=Fukomys damarensis TaxID=885580 RepID=A0A091DU63_FUKDA|nr:hypothetical protein H920_04794 [Fukomys damarensis]